MIWLLLAGCTDLGDPWPLPLDYRIDRVRVAAVRFDPPVAADGDDVTIDALVLAPGDVAPPTVQGCGLQRDAVTLATAACFDTEALVFDMGTGLPATWTAPVLRTAAGLADCPDAPLVDQGLGNEVNPCVGSFPVLVTAVGPATTGRAVRYLDLTVARQGSVLRSVHDQDVVLDAPLTAAAGDTVDLALTWVPDDPLFDEAANADVMWEVTVRWYVDAGVLTHTGATSAQREPDGSWVAANALRVPRRAEGGLRVAAVLGVRGEDPAVEAHSWYDAGWRVATVEVSP